MANIEDARSLPWHRRIAPIASVLLFICLFLPWVTVSLGSFSVSTNGWQGIGTVVGIGAIGLVVWEVVRFIDQAPSMPVSHDFVTAGIAGLTALFGLIQFIRSLVQPSPAGPGIGTFFILAASIAIGYAAYLAFQHGGGVVALKESRGDTAPPPPPPAP